MKETGRTVKINVPIYDQFVVIHTGTPQSVLATVEELTDKDTAADLVEMMEKQTAVGCTYLAGDTVRRVTVVYVPRFDRFSTQSLAILVHELFHATSNILMEITGTPHTQDSEEAYAYLLAYLTNEAIFHLTKRDDG